MNGQIKCEMKCETCRRTMCTGARKLAEEAGGQKSEVGKTEDTAKTRPFERRADKRDVPLWRPMDGDLPEGLETVLLLISDPGEEGYVTSAYNGGSRWLCAQSATPINGRKIGWMPMREAVCALAAARRVQ